MGKLSFKTFERQWEWPGIPTSSENIQHHIKKCLEIFSQNPAYYYMSNTPCPAGHERLNYLFRAIFKFSGSCIMTASYDGKIMQKELSPGIVAVGGTGNWSYSNKSDHEGAFSIIFMRELTRLVYSENGQSFYCHYPPASGILAELITCAGIIISDRKNSRSKRMNALMTAICEQLILDIQDFEMNEEENFPKIVEQAIHYIHLNFQHPISCSTVAEAINVNRTMLSGEFHKAAGVTMKEFILDLRLDKAKWLLESGSLKIKKIAEECGFTDTGYFIRVFHKKFNITPDKYKKKTPRNGVS